MNDCIWFMFDICDCDGQCLNYLSINSNEGQKMHNEYQKDIDEALIPVREKFKEKYFNIAIK